LNFDCSLFAVTFFYGCNLDTTENMGYNDGAPVVPYIHSSARDRATAALMACQHLPHHCVLTSQPSAMLEDAIYTYEKLGDQRALASCRRLMTRFIAAAAPIGC
jgi:hypothetical protein